MGIPRKSRHFEQMETQFNMHDYKVTDKSQGMMLNNRMFMSRLIIQQPTKKVLSEKR